MMGQQNENFSFFKACIRLITHHFWLKCLSFLFAFVLFFIIRTDKDTIYESVAKIKIITPPNIVVVGDPVRTINVSVRLQNTVFAEPPTPQELTGEVDINETAPGHFSIKINRQHFPQLQKRYILTLDKPYIEVDTDKLISKSVPIKAQISGMPKWGYFISSVEVNPSEIKLSGAKQYVQKIEAIYTSPLNVNGASSEIFQILSLDDQREPFIQKNLQHVNVIVHILQKAKK